MLERIPKTDVTVVIRAHNEENNIVRCLESLLLQNYSFRAVIVNNGSTDDTQTNIKRFLANNKSFPARIINEPQKGRGMALQRGVDCAKTEIVVCLDGDTYTNQSDWLEKLIFPLIKNQGIVASSGRIKFYNGPLHHRLIYDLIKNLIYASATFSNQGWLSLANCAFRKSDYYKIGGTAKLNGDYPEDRIIALRLRPLGKIAYVPEALVYTNNWLLIKKTWGTHLIDELDNVRNLIDKPESQIHKIIRYLSLFCSHWDQIKINSRRQFLT